MSSNGTVLNSEIIGAVKMKSFLSGMPELKLGLNDKLMFEATGRSSAKGKVHPVCQHHTHGTRSSPFPAIVLSGWEFKQAAAAWRYS